MIPKKIHFVWVGHNPKSNIVQKCIASWRKFLPDFEIYEWGNEEAKKTRVTYVQEAFKCKKWAFVSDYLRLKVLYEKGGLYLDADLEITNELNQFLSLDFFSGFEDFNGNITSAYPVTALMGAKAKSEIIKDLLKEYEDEKFILEDGTYNEKTNTKRITEYFRNRFNLPKRLDAMNSLTLQTNCIIYPAYYFSTPKENKPNFSIHHFNGSWHDNYKRFTFFKFKKYKFALLIRRNSKIPFNFSPYGNEYFMNKIRLFNRFCLVIIKIRCVQS